MSLTILIVITLMLVVIASLTRPHETAPVRVPQDTRSGRQSYH
jgi:hypothetical protein